MGEETFLRVGIDGTSSVDGARVVKRSHDDIYNSASRTLSQVDLLNRTISGVGSNATGLQSLRRHIDNVHSSASNLRNMLDSIEDRLIRVGVSTAVFMTINRIIGSIRTMAQETLQYLGQIETSTLGIASSFLVSGKFVDQTTGKVLQGQAALNRSMIMSKDVIEQLKVANMQTIATLDQLIVAYQVTLPVAMAKGFNKNMVMDFTLAMVQAAGAIGLPFEQMAEETRSLLTGTINPRTSRIATVLGLRNEDITQYKGNAQGLFDFLMGRLEGFRVAGIESQKTWAGLWSNFRDISKQGSSFVFQGMFEGIKSELTSLMNNIVKIDTETKKITWDPKFVQEAKDLGKTVSSVFSSFAEGTRWVIEHRQAIGALIALYATYKASQLVVWVMNQMITASTNADIIANENKRVSVLAVFEAETARLTQNKIAAELEVQRTALSAAAAQEELRRAEVLKVGLLAEQEIHNAKLADIALNVEVLASEKALAASKLNTITLRKQEQVARLLAKEAQAAELAYNLQYIDQSAAGELQLAALKTEQANLRRSITLLTKSETSAELQLTEAQLAETAAIKLQNAAVKESAVLGLQLKAAQSQAVAATTAATVATGASTAAIVEHTAAVSAATIASRAYVAVKGMLNTALTALGGPIGAITTLLMLGSTAWMIWGNKAREATGSNIEDSIEGMTAALKKQNKEFAESERIKKGINSDNSLSSHGVFGASDKELAVLKSEEFKLIQYQDQIKKLGGAIKDSGNAVDVRGGFVGSTTSTLVALQRQAESTTIKIQDLKREINQRNTDQSKSDYVANPPKIEPVNTKGYKDLDNARRAYDNALRAWENEQNKLKLEMIKNAGAIELQEIENQHNRFLMSDEKYIEAKHTASQKMYNAELEQQKTALQRAKDERDAAYAASLRSPDPRSYTDSKGIVSEDKRQAAIFKQKEELWRRETDYTKQAIAYNALLNKGDLDKLKLKLEQNAYLEKQKDIMLDIQKIQSETNMAAETFKASQVGVNPKTGIVIDDYENALAMEKARHDTVQSNLENEARNLNLAFERNINNENEIAKIKAKQLDLVRQINEETIRANQNPEAIKAKEIQKSYDNMFSSITNTFPKLTSVAKLSFMQQQQAAGKYANETKTSFFGMSKGTTTMLTDMGATGSAIFADLAASTDQSTKAGFESAKSYSMAAAIMSTAAGIMQQLSGPDGWAPTAWARAALVGVMGVIQVAKIASTSFGGGGGVSASVPSGSFGASNGTTASSGLGNLTAPLMSVQDSQTEESFTRLTASTDNVAVAIGRLSKTMDDLTALFSKGGAGYSLATNAPGQNIDVSSMAQSSPLGVSALRNALGNTFGANGIANAALTWGTMGLSDLFGGLFGGENRITASGINLGVNQGQVYGQNYTTTEKGNWWTGSDASTSYVSNPELTKYSMQLIQPYINDITRMATTLGTKVNTANFTGATTAIATAGRKPEDIAKDLEAWTLKVLQGMSLTVEGLKDTVGEYDDAYAKLKLYNDALVSTNTALGLIGKTQLQGSLRTGEFLANMQQSLFGGMEGFNKAVDTYFTSMFTENEQEVRKSIQAREQLNSVFAEMGDMGLASSIPKTKTEFISLVNSLDLTTERGAVAFAALMGVSESFATMIDYANKMKQAQLDLDNDVYSRLLRVTDQISAADVYDKVISNQKELKDAQEKGLDVTKLLTVQSLELAKVIKGVAETISEANKKLIESSKQALEDMVSSQQAILNTIKTIMTGPLAQLSPESAYLQAKQQFATADIKDLPSAATALLDASKNYNASSVAYQNDLQMVLAKLGESSGIGSNPTLEVANAQLDKLEEIRKVISTGDITQIANLSGILSNNAQLTSLLTSYLQADAKAKADAQVAAQAAQAQATQASTVAQMNESMQSKAGAIAKEVMNMSVGLVPANMKYDINKDSAIDIKDALKWQQVSTGSLLWSSLGIPAFAEGGFHNGGLRIVGERGMEIETTGAARYWNAEQTQRMLNGSADNSQTIAALNKVVDKLIEQNRILTAQLTVSVASKEEQEKTNKTLNSVKQTSRQAANQ